MRTQIIFIVKYKATKRPKNKRTAIKDKGKNMRGPRIHKIFPEDKKEKVSEKNVRR